MQQANDSMTSGTSVQKVEEKRLMTTAPGGKHTERRKARTQFPSDFEDGRSEKFHAVLQRILLNFENHN